MITIEDAQARSNKSKYQHPMAYLHLLEDCILENAREGLTEAFIIINEWYIEPLKYLMAQRGFLKTKVEHLNNGWGSVCFTIYWDEEDAA